MREGIFTLFLTADRQASHAAVERIATHFGAPLVVMAEDDLNTEPRFYRRLATALQGYEPAPREAQHLLWAEAKRAMQRQGATTLVLLLSFPETRRRPPTWLAGFLKDCINQSWLVLLTIREDLGEALEQDPAISIYVDQAYSLAEGAETLQGKIADARRLLY